MITLANKYHISVARSLINGMIAVHYSFKSYKHNQSMNKLQIVLILGMLLALTQGQAIASPS